MIKNEEGQLVGYVTVDMAGRDIGGYVEEAKKVVAQKIKLPQGYTLSWSGQYEYMQRGEGTADLCHSSHDLDHLRSSLSELSDGNETAFREELSKLVLEYCVGVQSSTTVWAAGTGPMPPKSRHRIGRPPTRSQRGPHASPVSVKALAQSLKARRWRTVQWREGTNAILSSRFAALRVRAAHRDERRTTPREEQWLLIEWPAENSEPTKYWLATLPADTSLVHLVRIAKMRWRIERDYQELKQEFGQSHYEGRGWRGFHHHATLCIAAYGFLLAERLRHGGFKKNSTRSKAPRLPAGYTPRGSPTNATSRARFHRDVALSAGVRDRQPTRSMSILQRGE